MVVLVVVVPPPLNRHCLPCCKPAAAATVGIGTVWGGAGKLYLKPSRPDVAKIWGTGPRPAALSRGVGRQ